MKMTHTAIGLALAALGMAAPAYAQNCSTSVSNKAGDTITVTATLSTADPNENGEGEPILITTSGGEFTTTAPAYAVPQIFSYTATSANETINGTILGFDGDESCALSATAKANSIFSTAEKQEAAKISAGAATVSGSAWVVGAVCTAGIVTGPVCGLPADLLASLSAVVAGLAAVIAADPPDSNYTELYKPVFPHVQPTFGPGISGDVVKNARALVALEEREMGFMNALSVTLNRASAADAANATEYVKLQGDYVKYLERQLASLFAIEIRLRKQVTAALSTAGIDATITPSQALQFERTLVNGGFPAGGQATLASLGVTDVDMLNAIKNILFVQDINVVAGSFSASVSRTSLLDALSQGVTQYGGACAKIDFVRSALGTKQNEPGYLEAADLNNDGVVSGKDLALARLETPKRDQCRLNDDLFGDQDDDGR